MINTWKKLKRSGTYHRNLKKLRTDIEKRTREIREEFEKKKIAPTAVMSTAVVCHNNVHQQILVQNHNVYFQAVPPHIISQFNPNNSSTNSASTSASGMGSAARAMFVFIEFLHDNYVIYFFRW